MHLVGGCNAWRAETLTGVNAPFSPLGHHSRGWGMGEATASTRLSVWVGLLGLDVCASLDAQDQEKERAVSPQGCFHRILRFFLLSQMIHPLVVRVEQF